MANVFEEFKRTSKLGNKIYPILFQDENYYVWMPPSQFLNEMQMSTADRTEKMKVLKRNKPAISNRLQILPEIIVFQNYHPESTQNIPLSVMNTTQKMLSFKVIFNKTETFQLQPEKTTIQLAPGMKTVVNILFTPLHYRDYLHKIAFETSRETITLPIFCVGPRPLLDIPDTVVVPTTPVKKESTTTFHIANIGMISAILSLKSTTYFQVSPLKMFLPPGERLEVTVRFKTNYPGNMEEDLLFTLESGEQLISKLLCQCVALEVALERYSLGFPNIYIETNATDDVKIMNKSKHELKFVWMKDKSNTACAASKKFHSVNDGTDKDQSKITKEDYFMFSDKRFEIHPMCGEIAPFSEKTIVVSFNSKTVGKFFSSAYCDVSGSVERLPLMLSASCVGPTIVLSPTHMVVDLMFGKQYTFKLHFINQGDVDGEVMFRKIGSNFGTNITCDPPQFLVRANEKESTTITVAAHNPGPYIEDVCFEIQKSCDILKLILKGSVSSPKIRVEPTSISFGDIPIGFKEVRNFCVRNLSDVAFDLHCKVPTDGKDSSWVDVESIADCSETLQIPQDPKEFLVTPSYCTLYPTEVKEIAVQVIAGIQRQHETVAELVFHESESNPITVPIQYNAVCPSIIPIKPNVSLKNCYINCQVISTINIQNLSNVKGYFYSLPQCDDSSNIECTIKPSEGVFNSNQQFCLDLFLKCQILGKVTKKICINVLGSANPITVCELEMEGIGPTIKCFPKSLHWGELSLLHKSSKNLTLKNTSPIDASFTCHFKNKMTVWSVNVKNGLIKANESLDVIVSVFLNDADSYTDKLIFDIQNSKSIAVPISVKGVNSCIVIEPSYGPVWDFGNSLTHKMNKSTIILKNLGSKTHQIKWSNTNELLRKKEQVTSKNFSFHPQEFKLASMESKSIEVQFYNDNEVTIEEHWYLFGVIEFGRKELLKEMDLKASFVKPSVEKSKESLFFEIKRGCDEQQFYVLDYFVLKNTTPLDLKIKLSTNPPFQLVCEKSTPDPQSNECKTVLADIVGNIDAVKLKTSDIKKLFSSAENNMADLHTILNQFSQIFDLVQESNFVIQNDASVCVNVLFNENLLSYKKKRLAKDSLKIFLEDNPLEESISLVGEVNTPDVDISASSMVLECIPSQTTSASFKIKNTTSLKIKYNLLFHKLINKMSNKTTKSSHTKKSGKSQECKKIIGEILENCLPASSPRSKHYDDMRNMLLSIINLISNADMEDSSNNSYSNILDIDPKSKRVKYLLKTRIVQNILYKNFSDSLGSLNNVTQSTVLNTLSDKHFEIDKTVKEFLSLSRRKGELPAFASQEISVLFKPQTPLNITMKMLCFIEHGPSKYLSLKAVSGDVVFNLDKNIIDYGICLYHNSYTQTVTITNSGCLSFQFNAAYSTNEDSKSLMQMKILEVSPKFGKLLIGESITLFVKINPGIFGIFEDKITFDISNHEPVEVSIRGIGTFPQLDIDTDYSYKSEIKSALEYNSIGSITDDWLNIKKLGENMQLDSSTVCVQKENKSNDVRHFQHGDCVNKSCNKCGEGNRKIFPLIRELVEDDWVFVNDKHSCLPSLLDIKFTVERALILEQIKSSDNFETDLSKTSLHTFKRFLNFGIVTYNQLVKKDVELVGYDFCDIGLKILNRQEIPSWIKVTLPKVFNKQAALKKMVVKVQFNHNEHNIVCDKEYSFIIYLQIVNGAVIPIEANVTLTIPKITINCKSIDFGPVICGNIKVCSVPIVNRGSAPAKWSATIVNKNSTVGYKGFHFLNSSGTLRPNEHDFIRISYSPKRKELSDSSLCIEVEHNSKSIEVDLSGNGLHPGFEIIGPNIKFSKVLPFSTPQHSFFGICNSNAFPIEIQFHDSKRNLCGKKLNHKLKMVEENGQTQDVFEEMPIFNKYDLELWNKCEDVTIRKFGVYFICHQTSLKDNFHLIRGLRNKMKLPLVSIDGLLMNSIAMQETDSSASIRKTISQTYLDVAGKSFGTKFEDEVDQLENEVNRIYSHYCETNTDITTTQRKLNHRKTKPVKLNMMSDKLSSASSCSLHSDKAFNVSEDLILDILRHSFSKYPQGCIIGDLNSMFIESQSKAMKFILQSVPSSGFVHFLGICESLDRSELKIDQINSRQQMFKKKLVKLLNIAESWDPTNRCITLSSSRYKKNTSHNKKLHKKKSCLDSSLENESAIAEVERDIGIPSWIITSNHSDETIKCIANTIKKQMDVMKYDFLHSKHCTFAEYYPISEPSHFNSDEEPFKIYHLDKMDTSTTDISFTKNDPEKYSQIIQKDYNLERIEQTINNETLTNSAGLFHPIHIPAKTLCNFKVIFDSCSIGSFSKVFYASSLGTEDLKEIILTGVCDMPRFSEDPYLIFPKIIETSKTTSVYPVFDVSTNVFNFGSVFCKLNKESPPLAETLSFKNISTMNINMVFSFLQVKSCFSISPDHLQIPPKKCEKITIMVKPKTSGCFRNTLLCCVNDNPSPYKVNLCGLGVAPAFKVSQESLEFKKMPLYRQESKSVYLTNMCSLPLEWKIRNLADFEDNLFVSKQCSCLNGMSSEEIKFYYGGNIPICKQNKPLHIDVFEKSTSKDDEPKLILSKIIKISLECYDILFDCIFTPENESHINFGKIVVGSMKTKKIYFQNKGSYGLFFRINKSDSKKFKMCIDDINVTPNAGLMKPGAHATCIEVTWKSTYELNLSEQLLLKCHLIDVTDQQKIIAVFPLNVSVQTYFNK